MQIAKPISKILNNNAPDVHMVLEINIKLAEKREKQCQCSHLQFQKSLISSAVPINEISITGSFCFCATIP